MEKKKKRKTSGYPRRLKYAAACPRFLGRTTRTAPDGAWPVRVLVLVLVQIGKGCGRMPLGAGSRMIKTP